MTEQFDILFAEAQRVLKNLFCVRCSSESAAMRKRERKPKRKVGPVEETLVRWHRRNIGTSDGVIWRAAQRILWEQKGNYDRAIAEAKRRQL